MPHLVASSVCLPPFPFERQGYVFLYEALSIRDNRLGVIRVQKQGCYKLHDFCILKIKQERGYLLKAEKSTRPIPVGILKQALQILARFCKESGGNLGAESACSESAFLIDWNTFTFPDSYHVEIGFGSGRHLLSKAQSNPQETYIGVEIHTPSIEQVLRQIELLGLNNLYLTRADARSLLEVLPVGCVGMDVHFPVPWPKNPSRRILNATTLDHSLRVLCKDALLWLRTDDRGCFEEGLNLALSLPSCDLQVSKNLDSSMAVSKYEARWKRQHRNIYDLKLRVLKNQESGKSPPILLNAPQHLKTLAPAVFLCKKRVFREHGYFLNIQDVLEYGHLWLLVLSLGDLLAPLSKIVVWDRTSGALEYVGGLPFNTKAHQQAHQRLLETLGQEENFE